MQLDYKGDKNNRVSMPFDCLIIGKTSYSVSNIDELPDVVKPAHTRSVNGITLFFTVNSVLSNFHPAPFRECRLHFKTSEHYYQYHKACFFRKKILANQILNSKTPLQAKTLNYIYGIDDYMRKEWNTESV